MHSVPIVNAVNFASSLIGAGFERTNRLISELMSGTLGKLAQTISPVKCVIFLDKCTYYGITCLKCIYSNGI